MDIARRRQRLSFAKNRSLVGQVLLAAGTGDFILMLFRKAEWVIFMWLQVEAIIIMYFDHVCGRP